MTDLGDIRRLIGPRKRHVTINLEATREMKERLIDGDLEQLLDETRGHLPQHLIVKFIKTFLCNLKPLQKSLENQSTRK